MRVNAALTAALILFAVGAGCSRPWQASTSDLAPLNAPPYGQTRNSSDLSSQYSNGEGASSPNPSGPSEPQPPPTWPGARKVKTITIPAPDRQ